MSNSKESQKLQVYYFHFQGRSCPLLHVLEAAGVDYELTLFEQYVKEGRNPSDSTGKHSDFYEPQKAKLSHKYGSTTSTRMGFPMIRDEDLFVSQVPNVVEYVATKYGMLPEGLKNQTRARQFMLDFYEWFNTMGDLVTKGIAKGYRSPAYLHKCLMEDLPIYLSLAEKQISQTSGEYFFGDKPCYVDHFVVGIMRLFKNTGKNLFKAEIYSDPTLNYPRLSAIFNELAPQGEEAIGKRYPTLTLATKGFEIPAILGKAAKPSGVFYRPAVHVLTNFLGGHNAYLATLAGVVGVVSFLAYKWMTM